MTNEEMIKYHNGLSFIQEKETEYNKRTGKKLFQGRMAITYAVKKNMQTLMDKLKPYEESRDELLKEFRDLEKEQEAAEKLKKEIIRGEEGSKAYEQEKEEYTRRVNAMEIILKEGKSQEEYIGKLKELLEIEIKDVSIHKISPDTLDGIELDSAELEPLMFMIE